MTPLTSRRHPFVTRCRALATQRRTGDPEVLLDGPHLVAEALAAGVAIEAVAIGPRLLDDPAHRELLESLHTAGVGRYQASAEVLEAASPVRSPGGVVAIARFTAMEPERVFRRGSDLVVAAMGVQDPGNVGAIVRCAEAAGATGMVVTHGSADPLGWKALRGSAGSAFRLPLATGIDAAQACALARGHGLRVVATCPAGGCDLDECDLAGPVMILLGGEGPGLAPELLETADIRLRIPLQPPVESLNVSVAAGVILFEARRQRKGRPH